jgi:epoxyqueuosine reductase QueG
MPLVPDAPISFGVTEFCDVCGKCAEECPANAISKVKRTADAIDMSNNPGVLKWPAKHTNCLRYWRETGLDCGSCIRSCPFNKAEGWLHEATRALIGLRSGTVGQMILKMDDASGYGKQQDSTRYWKKDKFIHIKNI